MLMVIGYVNLEREKQTNDQMNSLLKIIDQCIEGRGGELEGPLADVLMRGMERGIPVREKF
jgi:hypothetical protein